MYDMMYFNFLLHRQILKIFFKQCTFCVEYSKNVFANNITQKYLNYYLQTGLTSGLHLYLLGDTARVMSHSR